MKSPTVSSADYISEPEKSRYSDLKVMSSAAGYYVGTTYENFDDEGVFEFSEPGSRDSGYFRTKEEAEACLATMKACEDMEIDPVDVSTPEKLKEFMAASTDPDDWEARCSAVKAQFGGCYPSYWYEAVIQTGLAGSIHIHLLAKAVDAVKRLPDWVDTDTRWGLLGEILDAVAEQDKEEESEEKGE